MANSQQLHPESQEQMLLTHLLSRMQTSEYTASLHGEWPEFISQLSSGIEQIFVQDYQLSQSALDNEAGQLCATYPPKIFLPTMEANWSSIQRENIQARQFRYPRCLFELSSAAAGARVRGRVPLPALICRGRLLCRSSTLSAWPSGEDARSSDKMLLDALCVSHIVDLTTESRPLLVPGSDVRMPLWTAEIWLTCYADFRRLHLPYPGCDFFDRWPTKDGRPLRYDWTGQAATLRLTDRLPNCAAHVAWQDYRSWDVDQLTANYLLVMLGYLVECDRTDNSQCSGLLLHCLSGWDRTPLFVSLIRLLLWSEGLAHSSLGPSEILRLCLGYDWFLWGHRLPDRLAKGQRILQYCFHFAGLAADMPELSVLSHYPLLSADCGPGGYGMSRAEKLRCVSGMFSGAWGRSRGANGADGGSSSGLAGAVVGALSAALFTDAMPW